MSVVLTVVSLGVRVALAYGLAAIPSVGVTGIWCSVPIGWFLADALGTGYYLFWKRNDIRRPGEKFLKEECPYLLSDNGKAAAGCF